MGEWIVEKEPTKTETGLKARYCQKCEHRETKVIPVIADDPVPPQPETPDVPAPEVTDPNVDTADNSHLMFWTALAGLSVYLAMRLKKELKM